MSRSLTNVNIVVISRCARTLYVFRRSLIHRLVTEGARVTAVGSSGDGYEDLLKREGIDFRHVPISRNSVNPVADVQLYVRLLRLFRELRPQVVHAFTIKPAIYATLAAAQAAVPVRVVTITGLGHAFTTASPMITRVTEWLYRLALARAALVFFQNGEDRDLFASRHLVRSERTRLIQGSGVDLKHFAASPLPHRSGGKPSFLMIARLLRDKGVMEFLKAATKLKACNPAIQCRLVGGSDVRNPSSLTGEEIEALRASNAVQWVDEVLDVRPYILAADVVVLPSYREGLPRSLLEGAAMGRALIATNTPGCREVVSDGKNGYLVPTADSDALAEAMNRLANSPETIDRFGKCARESVERRFDERVVIAETIGAYSELMANAVGVSSA